ncbi:MFS transporter [Alcaligenes faecalis]|uniref:MFS transporter n=1 Tax=Alcaligenes faecalis TaxID=511 RepID=UPI0009B88FD0|nr:MFS transporter [Alcaligenes faecalis]ATI00321.1 MFS transporter [Alcaligenes faecalis]AYZ93104.1 MFS transporter [Alcaligenes faecalis]MCX5593896.1 MFS transporter [Alcaligenes faecalis]QQC31093.1 MFS transporter [Alcaligenes faecalis]
MGQALGKALNEGVRLRELWAWAMYDFANSGYTTVILTSVYSAYFVGVIAEGRSWATLAWTLALSASYLSIMLTMPGLGAKADARQGKRRLLFSSTIGCVLATVMLYWAGPNDIVWALVFIALSNYCYCIGESIIGAFLPEIARPDALGRVSGWGWGFGYFGGMLALGLSLAFLTWATSQGWTAQEYVPGIALITATLFALSALPSFLFLRERSAPSGAEQQGMLSRLTASARDVHQHFPDFRTLLLCGAAYQAGIAVIITLSAVYATEAMGFTMAQTMTLIFTVNIAAAVGALLFGHVQDRIGHRRALALTLCAWLVMVGIAVSTRSLAGFWAAAAVAGLCIGSSQSAGRAMVGLLAPKSRLAEFFALWTFAIQLAAVCGPLSYGLVTWLSGGNHRLALACTGLFFLAGLLILSRLNFQRGILAKNQADLNCQD